MQKINKKFPQNLERFPLIKGVKGIFALMIFFLTFAFSHAELNVLWFTKSQNVEVDQNFKIDIYIEPEADRPIFTVSNTLKYDPLKTKFIDSEFPPTWTILSETPNRLTDENNGFLRRTGGLANGVNGNAKYISYEFQALEEGIVDFSLVDGFALDMENTDIGVESKKMRINILPRTDNSATSTKTTDSESLSTFKSFISAPPSIDISGKNAIHPREDYVFKINSDPTTVKTIFSAVQLVLINSTGQEIYKTNKTINNSSLKSVEFKIPSKLLKVGDYKVRLKTSYKSSSNENDAILKNNFIVSEKEFGVLASDKTFLDLYKFEFFSFFGLIVFISALYHIHRDHIIFRRLRNQSLEYHEISVKHEK